MTSSNLIKRALISVADKAFLSDFAAELSRMKVSLIASSGSAKLLREQGLQVTEVSEFTGFPEILEGRVKTLHPKIHAGILAIESDHQDLSTHQIPPFDLVIANLYPFKQTIEQTGCTPELAIENIDIGGSALIRAAAKNHQRVTVLVHPEDYSEILFEIKNKGAISAETRLKLAQKAFAYTAQYDSWVANYFHDTLIEKQEKTTFPRKLPFNFERKDILRYGENPHQKAAWYANTEDNRANLTAARQVQGKELSFNNILDADAAFQCVQSFADQEPACVIVKHASPCGIAMGQTLKEAYVKAYQTDPVSSFGGIIAFNQIIDADTVQSILEQQFVEVLVAKDAEPQALALLTAKPNIRVLLTGVRALGHNNRPTFQLRSVSGGLLIQETDNPEKEMESLKIVSKRSPSSQELKDLLFAWKAAQFVKSNAIVYAKNQMTLGIGGGQTSRVFSAKIAVLKAEEAQLSLAGAVMASDAFLPFPDTVEVAARAGITAIIQPGGSKQDAEVIAAADKANMSMVFTGIRHFRH